MKRNALVLRGQLRGHLFAAQQAGLRLLLALADRLGGEMRLVDLGREPGWEKSGISHQVARMADRRLATKNIYGADRRGQVVAATSLGGGNCGHAAELYGRRAAVVRRPPPPRPAEATS